MIINMPGIENSRLLVKLVIARMAIGKIPNRLNVYRKVPEGEKGNLMFDLADRIARTVLAAQEAEKNPLK